MPCLPSPSPLFPLFCPSGRQDKHGSKEFYLTQLPNSLAGLEQRGLALDTTEISLEAQDRNLFLQMEPAVSPCELIDLAVALARRIQLKSSQFHARGAFKELKLIIPDFPCMQPHPGTVGQAVKLHIDPLSAGLLV